VRAARLLSRVDTRSILVTLTLQEIPDTLSAPPLPGGVATVVRFFMQVPQWIQIGGAILAVVVGGLVAVLAWRQRSNIVHWVRTRSAPVLIGLATVLVVLLVGGAAFGKVSWDYMMHDNDFCTGCHVMGPAFTKFSQSEHSKLNCHDCHQQPLTASMRQLYLWVLERPEEIGPHAPVPNRVCAECHIREDPDSTWQRVVATAGHRVHLESDSAKLANVMCVTCHGVEVHRFVPPDATCGQSGCHEPVDTRIRLGAMASQTALHCVTCHNFTAPVSEQAAHQEAAQFLTPAMAQCFSCHDMPRLMTAFDARQDPHKGMCGTCHNPHTQTAPARAWTTCATSGCHAQPDTITPFHRGLHAGVLEQCSTCHVAHTWEVKGTDCRSCHKTLR
jgi:nitrate/TMAO reductase-like tetraheme cytochrome c subunit